MGHWGYKPSDNDGASDWFAKRIYTPIIDSLAGVSLPIRKIKPWAYDEARIAAATMCALGQDPEMVNHFTVEDIDVALTAMKKILNDAAWVGAFREPAKVTAAVRAQIQDLDALRKSEQRKEQRRMRG